MKRGFTIDEEERLVLGVQKYGEDWKQIGKSVGSKSAYQCE